MMEVLDARPFSSTLITTPTNLQDEVTKINEAEQDAIEALSQIFFLSSGDKVAKECKKEGSQESCASSSRTNTTTLQEGINHNGNTIEVQTCTFNSTSISSQELVKHTEGSPGIGPTDANPSQPLSLTVQRPVLNFPSPSFDNKEDSRKKRKREIFLAISEKPSPKEIRIAQKPAPISPKLWEHNQHIFSTTPQASPALSSFSQFGSRRKDHPFLTTLPQLQPTTSFVPLAPNQSTQLRPNSSHVSCRRSSSMSGASSVQIHPHLSSEPNNTSFITLPQPRRSSVSVPSVSHITAFQALQTSSPAGKFGPQPVDSSCPMPSVSETTSTISFPKGALGSAVHVSTVVATSSYPNSPLSSQSPPTHSSPKQRFSCPSSPSTPSSPSSPSPVALREEPFEENKVKLQQQIQELIAVHQEKLRYDLKSQIQKHYDLHFQQQAGIKQQVKHLIKKYQERKTSCPHQPPPVNEKLGHILNGPEESTL